jgi:intracellular multiplication protein IcmD
MRTGKKLMRRSFMFQLMRKISSRKSVLCAVLAVTALVSLFSVGAFAETKTLGDMADNLTKVFPSFVKLVVAISYIAGIGFAAAGIMKFKQHKDNPTQVPLGGPIAMIFIAAALIYLPTIIQSTGATVFGGDGKTGSAVGVDPFADK